MGNFLGKVRKMKLIKLFSFIVLFLIASYIIIRICIYYLPYEDKNLAVDASNYWGVRNFLGQ